MKAQNASLERWLESCKSQLFLKGMDLFDRTARHDPVSNAFGSRPLEKRAPGPDPALLPFGCNGSSCLVRQGQWAPPGNSSLF
jgi:hypothetical protein